MTEPMQTRANFRPIPATNGEHAEAAHESYLQMSSAIIDATTITRPYLSYYAVVLPRYISKRNFEHYKAAKHLLHYIRGISDPSLFFDADAGKTTVL